MYFIFKVNHQTNFLKVVFLKAALFGWQCIKSTVPNESVVFAVH